MSKNNKTRWWTGAILFTGFLLTFLMDLTGLELHQWLGIVVGFLVLYHLLTHLEWVNAVAERFFGRTSNRARLYLLVDILLGCGFVFIVGTGLLMSTWLQISLVNYDFWRVTHILFSIGTLATATLKLVMHWRWIATTMQKSKTVLTKTSAMPATGRAQANPSRMGRRQFLGVAGVIGVGALVAASSALRSLDLLQDSGDSSAAMGLPNALTTHSCD